ncbi:MAG: rRNA cytosine-C5-methyltransferase [Paludibacteraceae bacterium]|nr:rRNA cytosine-C5-methyltransferase [Paludibacteraceae bacterium]
MDFVLPDSFKKRTADALGEREAQALFEALAGQPVASVRANVMKRQVLKDGLEPVLWCEAGGYLAERPMFTMDPLFHAGCYYVQEASSMFLEQVFRQHVDSDSPLVLDLCAAPGGKSTHIASLLGGRGFLVSNEVIRSRVKILEENMAKWGCTNVAVTNGEPEDFSGLRGLFDVVVVDAPCSGEGMFRKDQQAIEEWSEDNVRLCAERQRRILADVYPVLKEGGLLIYSTCTYNEHENEENVRWIADSLGAEVLSIELESDWNVVDSGFGCHFYPHKAKGEGFFIAALRKSCEELPVRVKPVKRKECKEAVFVKDWLLSASDYDFQMQGDVVVAVPKDFADFVDKLRAEVSVLTAGVPLAQIKGKDMVPLPQLAFSCALNRDAFKCVSVDWEQAIAFLRRENMFFQEEPKGWLLLMFEGAPLGFVKNLGNRANNNYPAEWRIRMSEDKSRYVKILED